MKKRNQLIVAGRGEPEPSALRTISENGRAPTSRLRSASQAFEVAKQLDRDDRKRRQKRSRIYKAYNNFPPTEYSKLVKLGREGESNVNWGMLGFTIDNQVASFYDMLTERNQAAQIITKKGKPKERTEWSEEISFAFDLALQRWDDFLLNQEEGLLDMNLYGKGLEMWEDNDGFMTKHVSVDDFLVPDSTKINLSNFDVVALKWKYQLFDLYKAIKDEKTAESMGWNVDAVIEAMRWCRTEWKSKTSTDFLKDIKEGNIACTSHMKENVEAYIVFIREFSGKISKHVVLQDYSPAFSLTRTQVKEGDKGFNDKLDDIGFLFSKTEMFECYKHVFAVFIDNAGTGMWHNTPSLAEKVFVRCRRYDKTMNSIVNAIDINMSLILQGDTAEATEKLKQIVLGPITILPADVKVAQHRIQLSTREATEALQFLMLDMNRGIGQYRIHEKGQGGEAPTATQSKLDASEAAKLTGTQLRRFNSQHSVYYREIYRRLVTMTKGEEGYGIFQEFKDYLREKGVPQDAWKFENIHTIKSNMISGAGSPSFKLMAAQQIIQLTNITPKDEGQANAVRDAVAALAGRGNVERYIQDNLKPDPTWNDRVMGYENELMESPVLNPNNVMAFPNDNHVEHLNTHLNDMARTIALVNQSLEKGKVQRSEAEAAMTKLMNQGGHVNAHMRFLQSDPTKEDMMKQFMSDLQQIQGDADTLAKKLQAKMKEEADNTTGDLENDPEVRKQLALSQIAVDTKSKLAQIQIGALSQKHQARVQLDKEKAANQIAIDRAKAQEQIESKRTLRKTTT